MSDTNTPETNKIAGETASSEKPKVRWSPWKTAFLIVVAVAAVGLTVFTSVQYEATHQSEDGEVRPPPTYTGSTPLAITALSQAYESNNDFILVFTPCGDSALNTSILDIAVKSANQIRSTDGIYVGVFTMPANESTAYPSLLLKEYLTTTKFQFTMRDSITQDKIYNRYLEWKFVRE